MDENDGSGTECISDEDKYHSRDSEFSGINDIEQKSEVI